MKWLLALFLTLCFVLQSHAAYLYSQGMQAYKNKEYQHAFEQFVKAYEQFDDEDAAFMLATMYEKGLFVEQNITMAQQWYKRAATQYNSLLQDSITHQDKKYYRTLSKQLDTIKDKETARTILDALTADFGLKPHHENYMLPFGYREGNYDSYVPSDEYGNMEAEFQLSLRFDLMPDLLGLGEIYSIGYTQRSFWQIYVTSAPFRETNYNPEFFVTFPLFSHQIAYKAVAFGLAHQSNGQGNITEQAIPDNNITNDSSISPYLRNRSRSWNYAYLSNYFQFNTLFVELKLWYRFPDKEDDNPGLTDYLGHGHLNFVYPYGKSLSQLMLRQNFRTGKGAQQFTWSYPFFNKESVYWFAKVFTGYGESLIDYNNYISKYSIGFSFSR